MGTQNYPWHFILSVLLCTLMALEGKDTTTATSESRPSVPRSTNSSSRAGPAANSSDSSVAEPDTPTIQNSLLGTTSLSPSTMRMVGAESSALPTAGTGTTTAASSPPLSSATSSHSSSSSSSSSPGSSSAVPPSPQQSSTSSTTGMLSATTSHPSTALVSSPSSSAGTETQGPSTPRPVASTSPASETIETRPSATVGSSTGTPTPQLTSTALPQGQPTEQVTATSPPSSSTASAGSSAMTLPGEREGSTMNQGDRTTTETSHSLPYTLPVSTMTVGGEGRTDTAPTTSMSERDSLGTSPGSGAAFTAFSTTGTGTTTASETGTASSLSFSSTVSSHSSSSSPEGAVPPSPQQSSTSSTPGTPLATTSHPPTALVSSPSSTAGNESEPIVNSSAATTASTDPVPSTSGTSSMNSSAVSPSPQQSSTTGMLSATPSHPSTALVMATSPPSSSTASAGSSATTPPGEGESSTMNQEDRTTEPTANISHSLPATSLTTPSTTNLSTATSVNPSISTTCLTVSIRVQNVTAEEIHLSWSSSSSTGSLYSISVKDGEEINTRTTNETETAIENLLPGHVYTISVALSSCAGSNPASVTVRTDYGSCFKGTEFCLAQSTGCSDLKGIACSNNQAFSCRVWLENEKFNNTLYNSDSEGYINMSKRLKTEVLEAMHAELGNNHSDIFILGFRSGSVIADFLFLLPKEEAMDVGDIQTRLSNVLTSKFGSKSEVETVSVQSPADNISSWRAAVIVLGVLLGVALVVILLAILFYIHGRRRSGMDFSSLYTW
ncbi:mucin-5AC-like isoform X2 [Ammospiza nelsoni]|uniref:mucin-5AC-like isoform X2 n=1 Tax=Ammospiza nelsoni TaxID=2857394 RepID=UPI002869D4F4|nr:mucin-5AC-like isoform X2 [Ammospiza nelsoni]